ncbi:MAG: tRNA (adenosine(37)-N6)-dimethylallyltransferase MiaA [Woeseiaceae bacterium]
MPKQAAICLAGPTASGKTGLAIRLFEQLPLEIISVDSALVYRGMDIGTAKPDAATLKRAPHRLIDIRDPEESYSAGDFVRDAGAEMGKIEASGRIPLLVGGTMMYFRSLIEGIADLPEAHATVRARLDAEAATLGWPAMHAKLQKIDPESAARISPNDGQRIQRALEVFELSGRTMTAWQAANQRPDASYLKLALVPGSRAVLHERIAARLTHRLDKGLVEEVQRLRQRPGLSSRSPSMRAVGYRQIWAHLEGSYDLSTAAERALVATRQLAKRQLTWLRSDWRRNQFDPLEPGSFDAILSFLETRLS